ncbi:MAG: TPR repeat protein [Myxococcota bacterium]|jgi:TPR repeat protein
MMPLNAALRPLVVALLAACLLLACGDTSKKPTSASQGFSKGEQVAVAKPTAAKPDACQAGDAEACARMAAKRGIAGLPLHERACDLGRGESCYVVALIRDEAGAAVEGAEKDPAESTHFYALGCEQGYADACGPASQRLRAGIGAPANPARAEALDKRALNDSGIACANGDAEACRSVGLLHALGRGAPRNEALSRSYGEKAFTLFNAACDQGVAAGCRQLASCFHLGGCGDRPTNVPHAEMLYGVACQRGDVAACRLKRLVRQSQGQQP